MKAEDLEIVDVSTNHLAKPRVVFSLLEAPSIPLDIPGSNSRRTSETPGKCSQSKLWIFSLQYG